MFYSRIVLGHLVSIVFQINFIVGYTVPSNNNESSKPLTTRNPCDNFSRYVCHPFDQEGIFEEMRSNMQRIVRQLIKITNEDHFKKIVRFYKSCINTKQIKRQSSLILSLWYQTFKGNYFTKLKREQNIEKFQKQLLFTKSNPPYHQLFTLSTALNTYNTQATIPQISKPKLYLTNDLINEYNETRFEMKKVHKYRMVHSIAKILHETITTKEISQMMLFEIELSKIWKDTGMLGFENSTIKQLESSCPIINWQSISTIYEAVGQMLDIEFSMIQLTSLNSLKRFCTLISSILQSERGSRLLENYFKWSSILSVAELVYSNSLKEFSDFSYQKILSNDDFKIHVNGWLPSQTESQDRRNNCLDLINSIFPQVLSSLYMTSFNDTNQTKPEIESVFRDLIFETKILVEKSSWITAIDRGKLTKKIDSMKINIIGPSLKEKKNHVSKTYENVDIYEKRFLQNMINAAQFLYETNLRSLKNINIYKRFSALDINAYYIYQQNMVNVPMGILQKPVFYIGMNELDKYTRIGFILSHEISHAFDRLGINFDHSGNLNHLLERETQEKYAEKSSCFVHQYNSYNLPGLFELLESLADNLGLQIAYQIFKKSLQPNDYLEARKFFQNYAKMFCSRPKNEGNTKVLIDPHSPNKYRINGPISNLPAFNEAFQCLKNDSVYLRLPCQLW